MKIDSLEKALKAYNKIEDKRDAIRAVYDEEDAKLVAARNQIEAYMMQEMKGLNLQAYEVPGQGVANIRVKRRFGAADWSIVWDWVVTNKCPHFLQKRLLDSEVQKYLDDSGELPPGINTEAKQVIVVTKRG